MKIIGVFLQKPPRRHLTRRGDCVIIAVSYAGMAELADAPDLGSGGQPCRFNSCYPHHYGTRKGVKQSP